MAILTEGKTCGNMKHFDNGDAPLNPPSGPPSPSRGLFKGEPIEDLSREELLEVVDFLANHSNMLEGIECHSLRLENERLKKENERLWKCLYK